MSSLKSLGPLGVSPASGYGHVVGTSTRYYGEGLLNPKFYSWNSFFQIVPGKFQSGSIKKFKVVPENSFIYGYNGAIDGLNEYITITGDGVTYVYVTANVGDGQITGAKIEKASTRLPLFEPEDVLEKQTKARMFLGLIKPSKPFYKFARNLTTPVVQNCHSVPIAIPACINGYRGILLTTA